MHGERGLEEPALCCHGYRLGARIGAKLVEDRGEMLGDGAFGKEELVGEARGARSPPRSCVEAPQGRLARIVSARGQFGQ